MIDDTIAPGLRLPFRLRLRASAFFVHLPGCAVIYSRDFNHSSFMIVQFWSVFHYLSASFFAHCPAHAARAHATPTAVCIDCGLRVCARLQARSGPARGGSDFLERPFRARSARVFLSGRARSARGFARAARDFHGF